MSLYYLSSVDLSLICLSILEDVRILVTVPGLGVTSGVTTAAPGAGNVNRVFRRKVSGFES